MLISSLDVKHQARISNDEEFSYIYQDIAEFKKHHNDKTISLVESERLASREDDDKRALDRENARREHDGLAIVKSLDDIEKTDDSKLPDAFLDETAYITLDMADAEKLAKTNSK